MSSLQISGGISRFCILSSPLCHLPWGETKSLGFRSCLRISTDVHAISLKSSKIIGFICFYSSYGLDQGNWSIQINTENSFSNYSQTCLRDHLYTTTFCIKWPWFLHPGAVIFITIEHIFRDHLSYVTQIMSSKRRWRVTQDRFDSVTNNNYYI